ncbi:WXG100 family type VII secretion target [Actinoplanes sp. NPDC051851]|uniref:WXG100 family type VII secretion target n=1 Tax=Actinoplanes sp. NPDC051851 TaxID=3154753 RepID=UPI00342B3F7F
MAGTGFQSDAAAMARAVSGFDESAAEARSAMTALENELLSILSRYQGAQATSFWQLHTRLQEDMRTASRELDTMSRLVRESATDYGTGDDEASSSIGSLVGQTGNAILGRLSGGV